MTLAILLIGDGRWDYREKTVVSAYENLPGPDHLVEINDHDHELGFDGAIQEGWRRVLLTDATHIFHLEADYTFNHRIDTDAMVAVLDTHPHLVQVALRRQPWNTIEARKRTVVPDDAVEVNDGINAWLEHTRNFTTNPSVYPRWVAEYGWPSGPESEGRFGGYLRRLRPELRFAYWGRRSDPEAVFHIGLERAGKGY